MKRLLEEGSDFERELLGSAAGDRMPARARSAAIAAATAGTGIAATKAVTTALRGRSLLSLFGTKGAAVGWVAATVALGAAGVAGVVKLERGESAPALAPVEEAPAPVAPRPLPARPAAVFAAPPVAPPAQPPVAAPVALAVAPARPVAAARPAAVHVPSAAPATSGPAASAHAPGGVGTLGDQARLIESARQALRAGRPQEALARLDDFDRRYPGDMLAEEAAVARIEAVAAINPAAAKPLAAAYLASHPNGAYARVVSGVAGPP